MSRNEQRLVMLESCAVMSSSLAAKKDRSQGDLAILASQVPIPLLEPVRKYITSTRRFSISYHFPLPLQKKARPMRSSRGQKLAQKAKAAGNAPPPTLQAASAARSSTPPVPDFTYAPGEAGRIARRYVEQVCAAAGSRRQPIHVSDSSSNPSDPREALRWTGRPSIRSS